MTSFTIGSGVKSIGSDAFKGCTNVEYLNYDNDLITPKKFGTKLNTVIIGNNVTSIKSAAFSDCRNLTSATIGNGVTSIGERAFSGCSGLTSVTIGNGVTSIGDYAFYSCSGLASITIPNSVTSIGNYAFYSCCNLTSVTIGNGVTHIGASAFSGCCGLTSVTIPNSVMIFGREAFRDCPVSYLNYDSDAVDLSEFGTKLDESNNVETLLETLVIGNHVTNIKSSRTNHCRHLTSVTIGYSVRSIPSMAFYNCINLSSIKINNLEAWCSIDDLSNLMRWGKTKKLYLNDKEITNLVIPEFTTSITDYAFYNCGGLTSVTITNPNRMKSIGRHAFYKCSGLTSVTIPNRTSTILPNSVMSIGEGAFSACTNLSSFTIPNSVTTIQKRCFEGCSSLETLILGRFTKQIDTDAFKDCESITQIYSHNPDPPTCATDFPISVYKTAVVHVPNTLNAIDNYQADSIWGKFLEIYDEDLTGVETSSINATAPTSLINLNGQYITDAQRGIAIEKMSDGTMKKVLKR